MSTSGEIILNPSDDEQMGSRLPQSSNAESIRVHATVSKVVGNGPAHLLKPSTQRSFFAKKGLVENSQWKLTGYFKTNPNAGLPVKSCSNATSAYQITN